MLAGLVGLFALVRQASQELQQASHDITRDFAPGVLALHEASLALHELDALMERVDFVANGTAQAQAIEDARRLLSDRLDAYEALPIDPGERPLRADVEAARGRLDALVREAGAASRRSPDGAADLHGEVNEAVETLDDALLKAAQFNADLAERSSDVVSTVSRRLLPQAASINVVGVLAAGAAIFLVYTSNRRAALAEAKARAVLERKTEELEAFSGRVSHDLLSPLMTVSLAVTLAERRLGSSPEDERARAGLRRAGNTLQRVSRLVQDLLAFARAGAAPVPGASTDVGEVLRQVITDFEPIAAEARVTLVLEPVPELRARCSGGLLISIASNLLQNAIKHLGDREERRVTVRALVAGAEVRIEVEDTGPGIAAADQGAIFEPYVRRDAGVPGLGLGLATVKRLVESHGGHVGVDSEVGRGSLFWVLLPAAA